MHGAQSTRVAIRRPAIRYGEEDVYCPTALQRSCFISADFQLDYVTRHFVHPAGLEVQRSLRWGL